MAGREEDVSVNIDTVCTVCPAYGIVLYAGYGGVLNFISLLYRGSVCYLLWRIGGGILPDHNRYPVWQVIFQGGRVCTFTIWLNRI